MSTWNPGPGATNGDDLFQGDSDAPNTADGLGGNDNLNGGQANDILIGNDGDDHLAPGFGDDVASGGAGDDVINVASTWIGAGDTIDGGADSDTLNLFIISDARFEMAPVTLSSFEHLVFFNGFGTMRVAFAGEQIGPGLSATATITGQNTTLDSIAVEFSTATTFVDNFVYDNWETRDVTVLRGSNLDDSITGSAFTDELYGNDGADTLSAGDGGDRLEGGAGNDTLSGGAGSDFIIIGTGTDTVNADADDDDIAVFESELSVGDTFNGGTGFDSLHLFNDNASAVFALDQITVSGIERIDNSS